MSTILFPVSHDPFNSFLQREGPISLSPLVRRTWDQTCRKRNENDEVLLRETSGSGGYHHNTLQHRNKLQRNKRLTETVQRTALYGGRHPDVCLFRRELRHEVHSERVTFLKTTDGGKGSSISSSRNRTVSHEVSNRLESRVGWTTLEPILGWDD